MSECQIDRILVEEVLKGDKEAFSILVRKYSPRLLQTIGHYIHDSDEALDVLQETFIRAYRALSHFRGDCMFYTWVYRIAINSAKNYLKTAPQHFIHPDNSLKDNIDIWAEKFALEEEKTPEYQLIYDETENAVENAFKALPESLRASIILREIDGLSYEEIAKKLHCPVGTVRSRIFRARALMDEQMKDFLNRS